MIRIEVQQERILNFKHVLNAILDNKKVFLVNEGTNLQDIMIEDLSFVDLVKNKDIEVHTYNLIQQPIDGIKIVIRSQAMPFLYYSTKKLFDNNKNINKHFGIFVGGSRWNRLYLASNLFDKYKEQSLISYRQTLNNPTQPCSLQIDDLYNKTAEINNSKFYNTISNFIANLPMNVTNEHNDNSGFINFDQAWNIYPLYQKIFVDIVAETFHSGHTFYPTEKTSRPIACYTPFIVFGPKNYLQNLKKIGFRTFNNFWSEQYDKHTGVSRIIEINRLVDSIATMSINDIKQMYTEMQPILEHNIDVYKNLNMNTWNKNL